jgi:lipopolysaccharide export LptBFGC system permease protein LptF
VGLPVAALPGRDPVMEMDRFSERPSDFVHEVRPWDFLTSREMARYLRRHPGLSPRELAEKRVKLHGRQAMPWACLVVTLFAVPAGARTGRQSALVGVFLAVACFFLFYAAEHVGMYVGIRQWVTPWVAAWLPNLGFLVGGAYMLFRAR